MFKEIIKRMKKRFLKQDEISAPRFPDIVGETQEDMIHRVLLTLGFEHDPDGRFDYHNESSVANNYVAIYQDHLYVKIYAKAQAYTDSDSIPFPLVSAQKLADLVIYNTYLD